jgi:hypothetical protein
MPASVGDFDRSYLDDIDPVSIPGRMVVFDPKRIGFITKDDGKLVRPDSEFIAHCEGILVGWIKFNGKGQQPTRHMGQLFRGFKMPDRNSLGDLDESKWPAGLNGKPSDPWLHQQVLGLESVDGTQLLSFCTTTVTGRKAVGSLLRVYERALSRTTALPVVQLHAGSFEHSDSRIGLVHVPVFKLVGWTEGEAIPQKSIAEEIDDELPAQLRA